MLGEIIRTFPMGATSSTTPSSEVQMERGLVLAQELVERLSHVRPNEHSVSSHRIRLVRAHALAIVDLLEEAVLGGL